MTSLSDNIFNEFYLIESEIIYVRNWIVLLQTGVQPLQVFNDRALVSVDVELPTFDARLVQSLRGEGAALSR